ncbi:hypothetical protein BCR44DRAFT_257019 [Catenaria anguillulae PL171]|uniref:Uncharacterized protein n=1 Tax=Catenaria anguillulae PL171 TaxID=765915 RepID=A0A1Y2H7G1_9FUNG|nr:hypothetical protein BCR44DRAFT_257019 [Catenaria anguillulae PL171]
MRCPRFPTLARRRRSQSRADQTRLKWVWNRAAVAAVGMAAVSLHRHRRPPSRHQMCRPRPIREMRRLKQSRGGRRKRSG